ncbi:hypothetical protein WME76_02215 [Sorangium sp. So ce119]|uniref:hypothetical protein n=1 Tax=Sorangium sp. So ce119 TaxID=3133279 RepID=UPI003F5FB406
MIPRERSILERIADWMVDAVFSPRAGYDVKLIQRPTEPGELDALPEEPRVCVDDLEASEQRSETAWVEGRTLHGVDLALTADETVIAVRRGQDILECTAIACAPVTVARSKVLAALREAWRNGEWISSGWTHDYERALEGSGMKDAAELIATRLGIAEADLQEEPRPHERLIGVEQPEVTRDDA